jgi:hypothetical protein
MCARLDCASGPGVCVTVAFVVALGLCVCVCARARASRRLASGHVHQACLHFTVFSLLCEGPNLPFTVVFVSLAIMGRASVVRSAALTSRLTCHPHPSLSPSL